jgi:hypothetical protein
MRVAEKLDWKGLIVNNFLKPVRENPFTFNLSKTEQQISIERSTIFKANITERERKREGK